MDEKRYMAELSVLRRKLPNNAFVFQGVNTSTPKVLLGAKTNSGNVYTLTIYLENFPESIPKVLVDRMLYTKSGEAMSHASATMHTLSAENNKTRICHYGVSSWTPNVSIFKIYVKCRLWLEIYELHLESGKPMDWYLNHQS